MTKRNREMTLYERAIYDWLVACDPDTTTILSNSDGPRPPGEYTLFEVTAFNDMGTARKRVLDEEYQGKCRGEVLQEGVGTVSVQTFGKTAASRLAALKMSYYIVDIQIVLRQVGLSIRSSTDSLDLTAIEGTRSVPRFSTSFQFGYALAIDYAADVIENLELQEI